MAAAACEAVWTMSGAKLLGTVLRSVAGSKAARTVKEILPRRIGFVPAEKPESLNRDMERLRFVPLNGPGAAAAARSASKKGTNKEKSKEGDEKDDNEEDDSSEEDSEEDSSEDPLGFHSDHFKDLTVWYTALSAPKRSEMRNVGAGLVNLGNTCFLDATLQCLTHTVPFAGFFLGGDIAKTHDKSACLCTAPLLRTLTAQDTEQSSKQSNKQARQRARDASPAHWTNTSKRRSTARTRSPRAPS